MISLVILAAGKSTRMKENKLLLSLNGETLIEHVVKTATRSIVDDVIVVLGYEAQKVKERLARLGSRLVINKNYEKGQSESVKAGLKAVSPGTKAVMILPADVALIEAESINKVANEYRRSKSPIIIASHQQQSGHPILIDRALFPEVLAVNEETLGLKAVIDRHRPEITYVEVDTENVLIDIDTQEEFNKYFRTQAASRGGVRT
jgi:molybdenum cofactor cytidylyltransferase